MNSRVFEEIDESFTSSTPPWFPNLSKSLIANTWRSSRGHKFEVTTYGTHRWLNNDPAIERSIWATFDLDGSQQCHIESLPSSSRSRYKYCRLEFFRKSPTIAQIDTIQSAIHSIASIPTLYSTISSYLRIIHLLQAPESNIDVSHSDPDVPFSIFVSVPNCGQESQLRLAESIVHECMHLQLTLIDSTFPLVKDHAISVFSPWQQTLRPLYGVIHGLYVFTVICQWVNALIDAESLGSCEKLYLRKRQTQIIHEIEQVDNLSSVEGLTEFGRNMTNYLLRNLNI